MQTGIKEEAIGHTGHAAAREGLTLATAAPAAAATAATAADAETARSSGKKTETETETGAKTGAKTKLIRKETPGASNPKAWNI